MTIDRNDPKLREHHTDGLLKGQQKDYLVLSEEERAKGFVRPVCRSYKHLACGAITTMGTAIAETYARNPKFYSGTFCCGCGSHFDLGPPWNPAFLWTSDDTPVGSLAAEAEEYLAAKKQAESDKRTGEGI